MHCQALVLTLVLVFVPSNASMGCSWVGFLQLPVLHPTGRGENHLAHKCSVSALVTGPSFLHLAEPLLLTVTAVLTEPWPERVQ